jgi:hypothetical protein
MEGAGHNEGWWVGWRGEEHRWYLNMARKAKEKLKSFWMIWMFYDKYVYLFLYFLGLII